MVQEVRRVTLYSNDRDRGSEEKTSLLGLKGFPLKPWFHARGHWNSSASIDCCVDTGQANLVLQFSNLQKQEYEHFPCFSRACWGLEVCSVLQDQRITRSLHIQHRSMHYLKVWKQGRLLSLQRRAGNQRFHKPFYCNYWELNWCSERWAHQAGISQTALTSEVTQPQDLP